MSLPAPRPERRRTLGKIGPGQKGLYLRLIGEGLTNAAAAKAAGRHPRSWLKLRQRDPEFAKAYEMAFEQGNDRIRDEVRRRALEGVEERTERVRADGKVEVTKVTKLDGRALELLARMRLPELRGPSASVSVNVGAPAFVPGGPDDHSAPVVDVIKVLREVGAGEEADRLEAWAALKGAGRDPEARALIRADRELPAGDDIVEGHAVDVSDDDDQADEVTS